MFSGAVVVVSSSEDLGAVFERFVTHFGEPEEWCPVGGFVESKMETEFTVEELVSFAEQLPRSDSLEMFAYGNELDTKKHRQAGKAKPKGSVAKTKFSKSGAKTTNVDRCRRYRDKRRKEEAQVYTENFELKRERAELQRQITQLEVEVQTLRGQGVVNLSKENELLRREIEKHRQYIQRVVAATKDTPLQVEQEEEQRLLKSGIESAVGHVVGIMYSSMTDVSWSDGEPLELLEGIHCKLRHQYLPTGSTYETAQRINTRIDCSNIQISAQDLFNHGALMAREVDKWEATFKGQDSELLRNIHVEEVHPAVRYDDNEFISCSRMYSSKAEPAEELIFVHAAKVVKIYSTAFEPSGDEIVDLSTELTSKECKMLVSTTTDVAVKESPESQEVKRGNSGFHSEGFVVYDGEGGTSRFSLITTQPMPKSDASVGQLIIGPTGVVKEEFVGLLRDSLALLIHGKGEKSNVDASWR